MKIGFVVDIKISHVDAYKKKIQNIIYQIQKKENKQDKVIEL